jgi:hypothetical protein
MDQSDILRKKQAQAVYSFYKTTVFSGVGLNTVTTATSPNLTFNNHGLKVGDNIVFGSISGNVAWSGAVTIDTVYYVTAVATNTFQFSATSGGSAITWTGTPSLRFYGPNSCITRLENCTSTAPCTTTFPSYEERQQFITGGQVCNSCSNTGCGCGR